MLAQRAALAALQDEAHFRDSCARVITSREQLCAGLRTLGFEVLPSAANFVFARHPGRAAGKLFSALRERYTVSVEWPEGMEPLEVEGVAR